jgi:hypothetical protein
VISRADDHIRLERGPNSDESQRRPLVRSEMNIGEVEDSEFIFTLGQNGQSNFSDSKPHRHEKIPVCH